MKEINKIYAVLTSEGDKETICALKFPNEMMLQAATSSRQSAEKALKILQEVSPNKILRIVSFERVA